MPERTDGGAPRQHDELSSLLRRLRSDAGLSGPAAAKLAADISQSSISRYERGLFVPGVEQAAELARVYGASPDDRRRLLQMVRDLRENTTPSARVVMRREAGELQARIGRIEASSVRLRTFQPLVIAGLLQTEAYLRVVFASGNDLSPEQQEAAVAARLDRQQLLHDDQHQITIVLAEGALRWQMGGPDVMVDQLEHLAESSLLPNVRFGVIPWTRRVTIAPMHGFDLFDERAALVGTETATAFLTNPADVAAYAKLFSDLEALAVFDGQARDVLAALVEEFRALL